METKNKTFKELYEMPVEGHVEKKDCGKGLFLSYLSWAYAWATLIEEDPNANYKVYERPDGRIYWDDGTTAWVKVSVTMFGKEVIEYLAVMDDTRANASIPLVTYKFKNKYGEEKTAEGITTFDAVKAIQRALVKAIARFGIGLKLYAGEDLPTEGDDKPQNDAPQAPKPQTIPSVDPKPKAEAESTKSMTGNAQPIYDEMMKMMRELDPAQTIGLLDWCKRKFGKGPNDLTDINQILATIGAIKAAKFKADKPISDDNMPF